MDCGAALVSNVDYKSKIKSPNISPDLCDEATHKLRKLIEFNRKLNPNKPTSIFYTTCLGYAKNGTLKQGQLDVIRERYKDIGKNTLNKMLGAKPKRHSVNAHRPSGRKITLPKFKCMENEE